MNDRAAMRSIPPILDGKHYTSPTIFRPENLLREARRQKGLPDCAVPEICILDPDGDIVRRLRTTRQGEPFPAWACYHTEMLVFDLAGTRAGIVGCAVGAPFAVLVAEQMFASGCRLLLSITSAGRIAADLPDSACFVLIDRALRDEGTSYHYLPPGDAFAWAHTGLAERAAHAANAGGLTVRAGATWTTDAPFRETEEAIAWAAAQGLVAVEMEAAALYAFGRARGAAVLCFAHVTNQMARIEGDFEKGEADGADEALRLLALVCSNERAFRAVP
jgi:uridine phosphorylase